MAVRTAYVPVAGAVLTAANLAKLPGGWIGDAQVTANQGSVTTEVSLTGLTVTVTVGTGRRIRVGAQISWDNATAGAGVVLKIKEGATVLQTGQALVAGSFVAETLSLWVTLTPSSGAHTYNLTLAATTGTADLLASATQPAIIYVEDVGATP